MDFETALHEDLGNHYQRIMKKYKITPEAALHIAGMLTAAQTQASYLAMLKAEMTAIRALLAKREG